MQHKIVQCSIERCVSVLQPSLGVSSQTWAVLRGGSFSGRPINVPVGEMADAARFPNPCCTALLRGPPPWLRGLRPVRLSGTVYCHKAGLAALDVLRQRWMVAGWTLKVLATSLMDRPSSTRERARVF